jgi:hypothetical protein
MSKLLEALAVMAELTGTDWSKPAIQVIEQELSVYPEQDVLGAIRRCQGELRHRVTLADILDRLEGQHPGVEEAWAMVSRVLNDDEATTVWTDEMRRAFGVASSLKDDPIAARMAFKETYQGQVSDARAQRKRVHWQVSLGWDKQRRESVLLEAVEKGRLTRADAAFYLPEIHLPNQSETIKLLEGVTHALPAMPRND